MKKELRRLVSADLCAQAADWFRRLVCLLALSASPTLLAGYNAGVPGCFADFEQAKAAVCSYLNPDTISNPGYAYYRDSCVTTTIPSMIVYARVVTLATGQSGNFSYSGSLSACGCPANASFVGGTCACDAGYLKDTQTGACYSPAGQELVAIKNAGPQRDPNCTNPVNGATGNKYQPEVDYPAVAGNPLVFERHYNATFTHARALGRNWLHTYDRLFAPSGTAQGAYVVVIRPDGPGYRFTRGATAWEADGDVNDRLIDIAVNGQTQWQLSVAEDNSTETYDASGRLLSIVFANTRRVELSYDANGRLQFVTDVLSGRSLRFTYADDINPQIATMTDPAGNVYGYQYSGAYNDKRLSSVKYPGTSSLTRQYLYNENAHTGGASLPDALTGILDEKGNRYGTYGYDSTGRGVYTKHAAGTDHYALAYNADGSTTVTDPLGAARTYSYTTVNDVRRQTGQNQPAGSGCLASFSTRTYDANGNIASSTDFDGKVTSHNWDLGRNLPTQTVEGGGTAQARTIAMEWHPDWRLTSRLTEPGRRTTRVYQGRPDPLNGNTPANCTSAANLPNGKAPGVLCRQVVQALDAAGVVDSAVPVQSTALSYDTDGNLLSRTDPGGQVTSYSYHATSSYSSNLGGPSDADFDKVTLLLKGSGANGSTSFPDLGAYKQSIVRGGGATVSTAQSVFGGSSIAFDGNSDYLMVPYSAQTSLVTQDFTIEMFVYKVANNSNAVRLWHPDGDLYDGVSVGIDPSGNLSVNLSTTGSAWNFSAPSIASLTNGQWYHLAVVRSGGSVFAFVNGVKYTVTSSLGANTPLYVHPSSTRVIGGQAGTNRSLNGYIDEFRITRGKARYTDNFTSPTVEFQTYSPNDVGHSKGDLASMTNSAGHVTQFTQYDRAGRVRQMVDAKGVVTDISYTPRGWVSTVVATPPGGVARTTSYSYDAVGQVTGVSHPDGSTLSYIYDAAQRLVGVTDAKGNAVSYTLDNMGNRVGEEIKDPAGVLRRGISRSFDALNRLQQATGSVQ
jgi:YD repeat-containing protein